MTVAHSGRHEHYKVTGKVSVPVATLLAGKISTYAEEILATVAEGSKKQITKVVPLADTSTQQTTRVVFGSDKSKLQVTRVLFHPDVAGSLNNTYWEMSSPTVDYYIWYNVNSAGTDPAVIGKTGIEVDIATGATAIAVKSATDAAILVDAHFTKATVLNNTSDYSAIVIGPGLSSSADGGLTGFTITTPVVGLTGLNNTYWNISSKTVDYYVWHNVNSNGTDPAIGGKTGIQVQIPIGATGAQVQVATNAAISVAIFTHAVIADGTTDFTNVVYGVRHAASADGAVPTGFVITTTVTGAVGLSGKYFILSSTAVNYYVWFNVAGAASTDPAVGGKTGIQVNINPGDSGAVITAKIANTLNAGAIFTADTTTGLITNVVFGAAATASGAGTSGFTVTTPTAGHASVLTGTDWYVTANAVDYYVWYNVTGLSSTDPAPVGKTAVPVVIAPGDTDVQVATKTVAALNAVSAGAIFLAVGSGKNITVRYAVSGKLLTPTDGAVPTGFTITAVAANKAILIGFGTDNTLLEIGGWIYDSTNCEVRKIKDVYALPSIAGNVSQRIDLEVAFTNTLDAVALYYIPNNVFYKLKLINESSSVVAKIDGVNFPALQVKDYWNDYGLAPIALDGNSGSVDVEYWYS